MRLPRSATHGLEGHRRRIQGSRRTHKTKHTNTTEQTERQEGHREALPPRGDIYPPVTPSGAPLSECDKSGSS